MLRSLILFTLLAIISIDAGAQNDKKKTKKTTVTIVQEEDGKKTVIDTIA